MNNRLLQADVQNYILTHRQEQPSAIALKKSPFADVASSELAAQVDGWQRCVSKLPTWAFSDHIFYPPKLNLEQCSSEHTALIKQQIIRKGARVIDLTGGFGVDSCYMAQHAEQVIHCELNENLSTIVAHNAQALGVKNLTCIAGDGIEYLRQQAEDSFDYIYIDPSRRVSQSKVFLLEDCEPNIVSLQELFFAKSERIITKVSPLLDITQALRSLKHVTNVYVISLDNDCKELLFIQKRGFEGEPLISAIRLFKDQLQEFSFTLAEEKILRSEFRSPQKYLYEPDVSVVKAGAFKSVAKEFQLGKLHLHSHLYTSDQLLYDFPGKAFEIIASFPFGDLKRKKTFAKANITTRNFPLKVEEIRKKFKIQDGGQIHLFFTTDLEDTLTVLVCERR
ncbi:THUMP-like domain-containing protein [Sphingobacterium corticibacter]|uniref:Uncharacterized protein n=1 Tax=Sphingobacterium corticibacter TaxID=2171749 RepID=A0A2T8HNX0_9SPHI|nr:RsmD family RNA methyltransferase [Sphingobacterium corticibacter]PVH27115.1 hypothetical protein DC487_05845 [Sphingobacterium corticibacter]